MNKKISSPSRFVKISHKVKLKEKRKGVVTEKHVYKPLDLSVFKKELTTNTEKKKKYTYKSAKFILEKVYLQRPSTDPSKLLVYLYVDYGFLKRNIVKYFIKKEKNDEYKILADCKIVLLNEHQEIIGYYPMLHSSLFKDHPVAEAKELFIGLIDELDPNSDYYYTIECRNKVDKKLFARTKINPIKIASNSEVSPIFILAMSDLHGGHSAWFKRGKAWCLFPRKNRKLSKLVKQIIKSEKTLTFNSGFKIICSSGDLVDNGSYHEYWADLFECMHPLISQTALVSAIGNHDYYSGGFWRGSWLGGKKRTCKHFHAFLQVPRENGLEGHYFSFDVGNAHLIFLDSVGTNWGSIDFSCQSEEWNWLKKDIEKWRKELYSGKGRQFSIIFLHSAIFSAGFFGRVKHNSDYNAQCVLTPIMHKYGVNLAIFGHDHIYQRSIWFDTNYVCLGLSGGVTIGYSKHMLKHVPYDVPVIAKGKRNRGYAVIYVPPNIAKMSDKEREGFNKWLKNIENLLMKEPIDTYFKLKSEKISELENNPTKKREFIKENIIVKLNNHLWLRYYTIKNKLLDQIFLEPNMSGYNEKGKIDYELKCPEEHV